MTLWQEEADRDVSYRRVTLDDGSTRCALELLPAGHFPSVDQWREVVAELDSAQILAVADAAQAEQQRWGIKWQRDHYVVTAEVALEQAAMSGRLKSAELEILRRCRQHAKRQEGVWPGLIMNGQGANDRFDHVRQAEQTLAREAHAIAKKLAGDRVAQWRDRTPRQWRALAGPVQARASVLVAGAEVDEEQLPRGGVHREVAEPFGEFVVQVEEVEVLEMELPALAEQEEEDGGC